MSHNALTRRIAVIGSALTALSLVACDSTPKTQTRGQYVTDETIALLKASNTDRDWIFLLYGTAGKKKHDEATGHDTWSWEFYKFNRDQGIEQSAKVYERTLHVEFDSAGAIVRAWATSSKESIFE